MKSMHIITGGILVMVAVVFLAPQKQINTKEEASIPLDEIDAYILKEYGPVLEKLSPEEKELVRQEVADHLARDKAEMRKYGRVLTDHERSTQWGEEQDEAAYAKLYEERKEWIDNFPFQPRYHQNLAFDPENIAHSTKKYQAYREEREKERAAAEDRYDMKTHEIWSSDEMTTDEKHEADRKLWQEVEESGKLDPEIEEQ